MIDNIPTMFQSTLPRGERLKRPDTGLGESSFNPRSRVGSDWPGEIRLTDYRGFNPRSRVGSDQGSWRFTLSRTVSIHAPAWGATWTLGRHWSPVGVSIHAPAWGATSAAKKIVDFEEFQSTLPRGERLLPGLILVLYLTFQSTLPRGERLCAF